jgi:hypothetical protein
VVGALPAVFGVILQPEHAQIGRLLEDLVQRHHAGAFPFVGVRIDAFFDETADGGAEGFVVIRELHQGSFVGL